MLGLLARTAAVAGAYFLLGRLALVLAIPPGYATAVWPPAGIALAGVLVFGFRVWPGVFVGSILVTVSTSYDLTSVPTVLQSAALPVAIAAGASLQAVLGAFLVRRFVGFPSDFDSLGRILATMALGGPLACLVSATTGVASLLLAGSIEGADLARNWGTWWLGDSIGVLLVIPLASAWRMELSRASRRTRLVVSLPILGAIAITVLGYFDAREQEIQRAQAEFERRSEIMAWTLEQTVLSKLEILQSLVSLLESVEVDREGFRDFVDAAFERHPDLHGLSWNAVVSGDRRSALEEQARQEGFSQFRITERDADGKMVRAADRDEYVVVFYIEPYQKNEQALGYDLASDPDRRRALAKVRDTGEVTATPPIILVQETEQKPGFLFFAPIYKKGLPHDTRDRRRRNLHSFVSGVFRAEPLVEEALRVFQGEGVEYDIVDATNPEDARVLYSFGYSRNETDVFADELSWSTDLEIAGRRWTFRFRPSPGYASAARWGKVWIIIAGGLFFTSLLGAFLLVVAGRASAVERSNEKLRSEIDERRRAERALSTSENRFRAVFDNPAVGVAIIDADARISVSNAAMQRMLGYSGEELAAKRFVEFTHPEDIDTELRQFRELWSGSRRDYETEKRYFTKSGETVWVRQTASLVRNPDGEPLSVVGLNENITKRKVAEENLRKSQVQLVEAQRMAHFASWDWDLGKDVTQLSGEGYRILGVEPEGYDENLAGFLKQLHPDDKELVEQAVEEALAGTKPYDVEFRIVRPDGAVRICHAVGEVRRSEDGSPVWMRGALQDITESKRAEEQRIKLEAKVLEAQKLESLGVLAGGIAHDFNNLLVGVMGNAELALANLGRNSPGREYLQDIETSAERAADLANQLLAYSGKGKFVVESIDISDLVDEIANLIEVSLSKRAMIKYDLGRNLPALECDVTQVRQVVLNLITNASEAVSERGGVVSITTGQMDCDLDYLATTLASEGVPEGKYVFVEVADTGSGMDEETQDKIFDPFFTTKFTGRGLGLAAVLGIVRGHGGAIRVYSEPGRGTAVKVLFPASELPVPESTGPKTDEEAWLGEGTVLLVDDEEVVRRVGDRMLKRLGFDVVTAADGVEALEIFRQRSEGITLVILDLAMPNLGGEETFSELRRLNENVKVILSSGYNEQDSTSKFAGRGLAGFIQKPYRLESLRRKIREVLEA